MIRTISIQDALASENTIVDVRAPIEFQEDHILGATNIPLLNDEERHRVGCVYKSHGGSFAKRLAFELVAETLGSKISEAFKISEKDKILTLYCFRGGLRSRAFATFLNLVDIPVEIIEGGYKSYRKLVQRTLYQPYPFRLIVLYGYTGCGKTEILKVLEKKGFPVIDLEEMSGHRGSAFGHIGMKPLQSQKYFETLLYSKMNSYSKAPYVFIEGESRCLGSVILPSALMEAMKNGLKVWVEAPLSLRVARIYDQYFNLSQFDPDIFLNPLTLIRSKLGGDLENKLRNELLNKDYPSFISHLLMHYYDKRYFSKSLLREDFKCQIQVENTGEAAQEIIHQFGF